MKKKRDRRQSGKVVYDETRLFQHDFGKAEWVVFQFGDVRSLPRSPYVFRKACF